MSELLRPVEPADVDAFFVHQADPEAARMAAFPSRDADAHAAHWQRVLADPANVNRTIVLEGAVVGSIASFPVDGDRHVAYWLDRAHWGRGLATRALLAFLAEQPDRPLHARVAETNAASVRVLAKAGFRVVGHEPPGDDGIAELVMRLDRGARAASPSP